MDSALNSATSRSATSRASTGGDAASRARDAEQLAELARRLDAQRFEVETYAQGLIVPSTRLGKIALRLRDEERFDFLRDIAAVDWLGKRNLHGPTQKRFDVCYQLASISSGASITVKTYVDADESLESLCSIYAAAEFLEREVFDLFGIAFANHPDLRRILLSDDWEGHPLRKDYPVTGYEMWDWQAHR